MSRPETLHVYQSGTEVARIQPDDWTYWSYITNPVGVEVRKDSWIILRALGNVVVYLT